MNWYERNVFYVTTAAALLAPILLFAMMLARPWFMATFGVNAADGLTP